MTRNFIFSSISHKFALNRLYRLRYSPAPRLARCYGKERQTFEPALAKNPLTPVVGPNDKPVRIAGTRGQGPAPYHNIKNYEKAMQCVASLDPNVYKDTTVIEVNPGPGIFTRALFNQIKPKNYVLIDRHLRYKAALKPLVNASNGVIKHFDLDGWDFNSYSELLRRRIITPEVQSPENTNSSLLLVGNFTEAEPRRADGFVAQLLSFMYDKTFVYYFGRVKTLAWMRSPGWEFLVANRGHPDRKKMTVMREMTCEARVIAKTEKAKRRGVKMNKGLPTAALEELPNSAHIIPLEQEDFFPEALAGLVELDPLPEMRSRAKLEELEYLILKLHMIASQPINSAIKIVAPGADILLKAIEPYDPSLTPNMLTADQWEKLANAFHDWPFKPDVLEDETYVEENLVEDFQNTSIQPVRELSEQARLLLEEEEEEEVRNEI